MSKLTDKFEDEYVELVISVSPHKEFDPLAYTLYNHLYINPEEVAMDDLAKKTGYSLSAVSTKLKQLENYGIIHKVKKPGTKKSYYFAEKNIGRTAIKKIKFMLESEILPLRRTLPIFLKKYEKDAKSSKEELLKKQYQIVCFFEKQLEYQEKSIRASIEMIEKQIKEFESKMGK